MLTAVTELIKASAKISVLAGAGISVAAGIPDFRSPTGLFSKLKGKDLPYPEAIFDIRYFKRNPKPFFDLGPELRPRAVAPTLTHCFIKLLQDKQKLLKCYTQNIDGLEKLVGIKPERLVRAHGHNETAHCTSCGAEFDAIKMKHCLWNATPAYCSCGGVAKPDVVFFGEAMPLEFVEGKDCIAETDLVIVIGTSLAVFPFSDLLSLVPHKVPRVIINQSKVDLPSPRQTDLFIQADCDDTVRGICQEGGWQLPQFKV
jgi:NAD-dependent histone deacetylase SIR2